MKVRKPLTEDLESLTERLASAIQTYPEINKDTILQISRELDEKSVYGQKKECKDNLIQRLGYDTRSHQVDGSLQTISENLVYLTDLGVKDIRKVVRRFPQVLALDIENKMKPRVEYLKSIGVKEEDISKVVAILPQVLGSDVEKNLKPTYKFLQSNFNVCVEDIIKSPNLLSYSLEKRIKLRHEFLKLKEMENRYKASSALNLSDENFCNMLKCSLDEYLDFKDEYLERNKVK